MTKGLGLVHLSRAGSINAQGCSFRAAVHTQACPWQTCVRIKGTLRPNVREMSEINSDSSTQRKIKQLLETR